METRVIPVLIWSDDVLAIYPTVAASVDATPGKRLLIFWELRSRVAIGGSMPSRGVVML